MDNMCVRQALRLCYSSTWECQQLLMAPLIRGFQRLLESVPCSEAKEMKHQLPHKSGRWDVIVSVLGQVNEESSTEVFSVCRALLV